MRQTFRLLFIVLILSLIVGCTAPEKGARERLVDQAISLADEVAPPELIELITRERVNLLGEIHNIEQSHELYAAMIPGIYEAGVRVIMLEATAFMGPVWDSYVRGETTDLPWKDHPIYPSFFTKLIEGIRDFNEGLRKAGKSQDQLRLYTYDHETFEDKAYGWLVRVLRRDAGLGSAYFHYPKQNLELFEGGEENGLSDELNQDFLWLTQQKVALDELTAGKRVPLWQVEDEKALTAYISSIAKIREDFIEANVRYYLDKHPSDKFLIITGAVHAQREGQIVIEEADDNPLAQRLIEAGHDINSIMLTHYKIKLMEIPFTNQPTGVLTNRMTMEGGELFDSLTEKFADDRLLIDLRPLSDEPLMINSPLVSDTFDDSYDFDLAQVFDGMIVIPEGQESNINLLDMFQRPGR